MKQKYRGLLGAIITGLGLAALLTVIYLRNRPLLMIQFNEAVRPNAQLSLLCEYHLPAPRPGPGLQVIGSEGAKGLPPRPPPGRYLFPWFEYNRLFPTLWPRPGQLVLYRRLYPLDCPPSSGRPLLNPGSTCPVKRKDLI